MGRDGFERLGPALVAALLSLTGCSDENSPPVPEAPGTFLLDHTWNYQGTAVLTAGAESVPFPSADALDGSLVRFGADGRMLVEPPGFDEFQNFEARYSVVDGRVLRLQVAKSQWFPYEYLFGRASGVLLLNPEPLAGDGVLNFVSDVATRIMLTGAPDSAAAKLTDQLYADPRVTAAVEALLTAGVKGDGSGTGAPDTHMAAQWLFAVLAPSSAFDPELSENAVVNRLAPVIDKIAGLAPGELTEGVVKAVLGAKVVDATLAAERAEQALRFALYRRVLLTSQNLAVIERIELELQNAD